MSEAKKPGILTRMAYGFGAVAFGVKDNGFAYILLFFYSQVLGLSAFAVGGALMLALIVDAIFDPFVGYWSDNHHSKLGRRHPFMYAAILPVSIAYFFIWNPPAGLSDTNLFLWLVVFAITIRMMVAVYEVPGQSLAAELTDDYAERTAYLAWRSFFGWVGGVTLAVIAFAVFWVKTPDIPHGLYNLSGYFKYGLLASILIFASMTVCALGTHAQIPNLKAPPPKRAMSPVGIMGEIWETVSDRSFFALFLATLFGFLAGGISASLNHYLNTFFWEFTTQQISAITATIYVSAVLALVIAPVAGKIWGKKRAAMVMGILAFTIAPAPYFLRIAGIFPENGDPLLFPLMCVIITVDVGLIIAVQVMTGSMVADVVEESEVKTGRRSEGVFFSALLFIRKIVSAFGIMTATIVLGIAGIPEQATPDNVTAESVRTLGAIYAPVMLGIWTLMMASLALYKIDKSRHEANLETLKARGSAA